MTTRVLDPICDPDLHREYHRIRKTICEALADLVGEDGMDSQLIVGALSSIMDQVIEGWLSQLGTTEDVAKIAGHLAELRRIQSANHAGAIRLALSRMPPDDAAMH